MFNPQFYPKNMTNVKSLPKSNYWETKVRTQQELTDQIRNHAVADIQSLQEDFQHLSVVSRSIERNYQALLTENQRLRSTLLNLVDTCYCWQGNRCDRCQDILKTLAGFEIEKTPTTPITPSPERVREHRSILKQLQKLG